MMISHFSSQLPVLAILGGTGKEGPGLAMRWAKSGYRILIGSRSLEKAHSTAAILNQALGVDTVEGFENREAAQQADICILTVVHSAHQEVLQDLKDVLQGKILVDATARVDFRDPHPPSAPSAARLAQNILGEGVQVVAAFQNVPAHVLKKDLDQPVETDVLICADKEEAAREVIQLAEAGNMRAYYAGSLDNAVVIEGLTALLINLNKYYGTKTASLRVTGIGS